MPSSPTSDAPAWATSSVVAMAPEMSVSRRPHLKAAASRRRWYSGGEKMAAFAARRGGHDDRPADRCRGRPAQDGPPPPRLSGSSRTTARSVDVVGHEGRACRSGTGRGDLEDQEVVATTSARATTTRARAIVRSKVRALVTAGIPAPRTPVLHPPPSHVFAATADSIHRQPSAGARQVALLFRVSSRRGGAAVRRFAAELRRRRSCGDGVEREPLKDGSRRPASRRCASRSFLTVARDTDPGRHVLVGRTVENRGDNLALARGQSRSGCRGWPVSARRRRRTPRTCGCLLSIRSGCVSTAEPNWNGASAEPLEFALAAAPIEAMA